MGRGKERGNIPFRDNPRVEISGQRDQEGGRHEVR